MHFKIDLKGHNKQINGRDQTPFFYQVHLAEYKGGEGDCCFGLDFLHPTPKEGSRVLKNSGGITYTSDFFPLPSINNCRDTQDTTLQ